MTLALRDLRPSPPTRKHGPVSGEQSQVTGRARPMTRSRGWPGPVRQRVPFRPDWQPSPQRSIWKELRTFPEGHRLSGAMARSFEPDCPSCAQPMESRMIGTNGKLAWEQKASRLMLDGETVGRSFITTAQNCPAWRCRACRLLLVDHNRPVEVAPPVRSRGLGRVFVRARRRRGAGNPPVLVRMVLGPHRAHYHDNRGTTMWRTPFGFQIWGLFRKRLREICTPR